MKTILNTLKTSVFITLLIVLFNSCISPSKKNSLAAKSNDTIPIFKIRDSIPDFGNDTLFSEKIFTADDSAKYLIKSNNFNKPVSVQACAVSINAKVFIQKLSLGHFIAFDFPNTHLPLTLQGEIVNGLHPTDPPTSIFALRCEDSRNPIIVTSVARHSVWIRRLFLPRQDIVDFLIAVAQNADFSDLLTNGEKYKIIITPELGIQHISGQPDEEYVGGEMSVTNISTGQTSAKTKLHPCPVC